jgi:hypothetical protein
MSDDLLGRYNYAKFTEEGASPWLNFENSPPLGETAPDFPLWELDGQPTSLEELWSRNTYTVVEFGSFT